MTINMRVFATGKSLDACDILDISSEHFKMSKLHAIFGILLFQILHSILCSYSQTVIT